MMKKALAAALAAAMLLASCGISEMITETVPEPETETKSLYECGLEVVALVSEMVKNEDYIAVHSSNPELLNLTQAIAQGDYSSLKTVYKITVPDETLDELTGETSLSDASPEFRTFLRQKALNALPVQIAASQGVTFLTAASVCTASKLFAMEEIPGNVLYLYTYEYAVPVLVSFTGDPGVPEAGTASGVLVGNDELTYGTADDIRKFFREYAAEVETVPAG